MTLNLLSHVDSFTATSESVREIILNFQKNNFNIHKLLIIILFKDTNEKKTSVGIEKF